ncbi:fimbrial protein [Pantoea sp. C8B4]|uniref:fimbrial protein n=1 Tax=Pantoea sp. C8B4 TaxID=3243083 RepID=UPI003EDA7223
MRKSLSVLAPIVLMMVTSTAAQAATSGKIDIIGNVSHGTCDVKMSQPSLNLGNYTASDFPATGKTAVTGSERTFSVSLENCTLSATAPEAGVAGLVVTGPTLPLDADVFNANDTATTGVQLKAGANIISAYDKVGMVEFLGAAGGGTDANVGDINGQTQVFTAALVANTGTAANITGGMVSAPIMFMYDYN